MMGFGELSLRCSIGSHRDVTERKVFFKEEQKDVLQVRCMTKYTLIQMDISETDRSKLNHLSRPFRFSGDVLRR